MPKKSFSFQKGKSEPEIQEASNDIQHVITGHREQITRKTIALPEESFVRVKVEAAKRGIPAYQLWGEIVTAYFQDHPE